MTTIFALSSGAPPSGIAVIRISGPASFATLDALTRRERPPLRELALRRLHHPTTGDLLDRAMVVAFAGPASATGDDLVELHLHGGVAVVAAVLAVLGEAGLTAARPGAFTRRAFDNGRLDLAAVEALGDLVAAETEAQRRAALAQAGGALARQVDDWRSALLAARADLEATLDFADEDGVPTTLSAAQRHDLAALRAAVTAAHRDGLRGAQIRDGVTIALTGPVNAGKSTLLNTLARREAALVSDRPGTTRDAIEVRTTIAGVLATLIDTAGLRATDDDLEIEGIRRGVERARMADLVIAFGGAATTDRVVAVAGKSDLSGRTGWHDGVLHLSATTGAGVGDLEAWLAQEVEAYVRPGDPPLVAHQRQLAALKAAAGALTAGLAATDAVVVAAELRHATIALESLIGRVTTDDLLDSIFARFCIGK